MSKETKYRIIKLSGQMQIWIGEEFICSVPNDPSIKDVATEKITFVFNVLNNHDRYMQALQDIYSTYEKDGHLLNVDVSEIKQILTESKL